MEAQESQSHLYYDKQRNNKAKYPITSQESKDN